MVTAVYTSTTVQGRPLHFSETYGQKQSTRAERCHAVGRTETKSYNAQQTSAKGVTVMSL